MVVDVDRIVSIIVYKVVPDVMRCSKGHAEMLSQLRGAQLNFDISECFTIGETENTMRSLREELVKVLTEWDVVSPWDSQTAGL
jgi:hypothetical protein